MIQLADMFRACSESTRVRILHLLLKRGPELCVCDIVTVLRLPQPTVSRHLGLLRQARLVTDRRERTWMHYSLPRRPDAAQRALYKLIATAAERDDALQADLVRFDRTRCCGPTLAQRQSSNAARTTATRKGATS